MSKRIYKFEASVWLYPGMSGWHFVGVPKAYSEQIKEQFGKHRRCFGSIPISITTGKTSWQTSIFPDKKSGCYILPIKSAVRKKEGLENGSRVSFTIKIEPSAGKNNI